MIPAQEIASIAARIKTAQDTVCQIEPLTAQIKAFDLLAAYAVAERIHALRLAQGAVAVGRKIGFTNPEMWSLYGVSAPIWAHIYATTVTHLTSGQGTCDLRRFAEPKIEPEIVFHFHTAPPMGGDLNAILACVDWVAHAFEVVQSHYPGWRFQAPDTVADCSLHGSLLVGRPQAVHRLGPDPMVALERFSIELACNGELREKGRGFNVLGHPLAALHHLMKVLADQPDSKPLKAGEIVTTGTLTPAQPLKAGDIWHTQLEGITLPGLRVVFEN